MEDEQPPYAYEEAAEADEEPDAPLYPEEDLHLLDRTDVVANLDVDEEDEVASAKAGAGDGAGAEAWVCVRAGADVTAGAGAGGWAGT